MIANDKAAGCAHIANELQPNHCIRCGEWLTPTPRTEKNEDSKPYRPLSECCGVPLVLSVSMRWGRRIICSHCSKSKDRKVDTSFVIPTDSEWERCDICQFELRPNAPFYGGHQKDCSKALCDYEYCHGQSNGCTPDCSCKKNGHTPHTVSDSEDDAIEAIVKKFDNKFSNEDGVVYQSHYEVHDWLRDALRSYEDKIREKERKASVEYIAEHVKDWKEEGRREALDELERRMPKDLIAARGDYGSDSAYQNLLNLYRWHNRSLQKVRDIIADMRK